ncbi:MAG: cytochrome c biogenesis protein CcsA [Saprospiraceae bacterium]|nr:cytochrome c biogenesis protein CcsA [Saprospiraceae bacterium]
MKRFWWKALGVLILLYVFAVGLLTPIKPGIAELKVGNAKAGQTITIEAVGYNTHFAEAANSNRVWLVQGADFVLPALQVNALNENMLSLQFDLPPFLPSAKKREEFSLLFDNPIDGRFISEQTIAITQDSIDSQQGKALWSAAKVEDLSDRAGMAFPYLAQLKETIRNLYFHVSLWFAMTILFIAAMVFSIRYLRHFREEDDRKAKILTTIGLMYGVLGIITGAIWAKNTWGAYWSWDPKQNMTAIALLIYFAYFVLRNAFEDQEKKARLAAVYNIFAFATLIPLTYILPRMAESLHPGAEGNPGLASQDLDSTMRMVFYPAIIGWTLLGLWIGQIYLRAERLKAKLLDDFT